jgi:hypothetical protein
MLYFLHQQPDIAEQNVEEETKEDGIMLYRPTDTND